MLKKSLALMLALTTTASSTTVLASGLREPGVPNLNNTTQGDNNQNLSSNDAWADAFNQYRQGLQQLPQTPSQPNVTTPNINNPVIFDPSAQINVSLQHNHSRVTDVINHPWENLLLYAYDRGYLNLIGTSQLNPQQNITRGDFAFGLGNFVTGNNTMMTGLGAATARRNVSFRDVNSNQHFHAQVIELARRSIIHQGNNTDFRPTDNITREEAARMVFNLIRTLNRFDSTFTNIAIDNSLNRFSDRNTIATADRPAVAYLADRGMLLPNQTGQINPRGTLTRADAAALLVNLELYLNRGPQWSNVQPELIRIQTRNITPTSFDIEFTVNNSAISSGATINYGFSLEHAWVNAGNITNPATLPNTTSANIHSFRLVENFGHNSVYSLTVSAPFPASYFVYANLAIGNVSTPVRGSMATATEGQQTLLNWTTLELPHWNTIFANNQWNWQGGGVPNWNAPGWNNNQPNWNNNWDWNNSANNNQWGNNWNTQGAISFGCPHIEDEVRRLLSRTNNAPIFPDDVRNIREIWVVLPANARVTNNSLEGLQHFTNLEFFSYSYSSSTISEGRTNSTLTNFNPLSNLRNLFQLELRGHNISNIQALRNLDNLTRLDLSHNNISNVSEFGHSTTSRNLRHLTRLDLSYNSVSNWEPMEMFILEHGQLSWGNSAFRHSQR